MNNHYIVCGCKPWNKEVFEQTLSKLPGQWHYVGSKDELTINVLQVISPRYIFFLHWSWLVPQEITHAYECINFHMTDLPYGRGGSPLQNLILRGHTETILTAHRMSETLDEGPVYLKKALSLAGSATEILARSSVLGAEMIAEILESDLKPTPQEGTPVYFERRTPEMSELPTGLSDEQKYNFIRMLDAEGYPKAFEIIDGIRYEYSNAKLHNGHLTFDRFPA